MAKTGGKVGEETISPREMAQRGGVSIQATYALLWSGKVKGARKVDGVWRIPARTVEEMPRRKRRAE